MLTISFLQQFRAKSFFFQFLVDFFTLGSRNRGSANVSSLYPEPYFLSPCIRIRTYHLLESGSIFFYPHLSGSVLYHLPVSGSVLNHLPVSRSVLFELSGSVMLTKNRPYFHCRSNKIVS